ncbi:MAG: SIS domain-containing protein [Erysipelotrichaceae bacterium]
MIEEVFETGLNVVKQIQKTQSKEIKEAADLIAKAHLGGHKFFVTGSGHSHTVSEEFYGRAGGLAFTVPILTTELTLNEHPTKSGSIERLPGYASILIELYGVSKGDVLLIASNSGRNAYPIEMALEAHKKGAKVIAITSSKHSKATTARHVSGKHLMDIADVVIDNCGEVGDSCIKLDGLQATMCPTSSMANSFIVQSISVECASEILKAGEIPPVFQSLNIEGTEDNNNIYFEKYTRLYK